MTDQTQNETEGQAQPKELTVRVSNISSASSRMSGYFAAVFGVLVLSNCVGSSIERSAEKIASAIDENTRAVKAQAEATREQTHVLREQSRSCPPKTTMDTLTLKFV